MASQPNMTPELAYDEGPFIIRMSIAMGLLATLFVCLRLWARTRTRIGHGLDDWILISVLLFSYGYIALGISAVHHVGFGKHIAISLVEEPEVVSRAILYIFVGDLLYGTNITLLKVSVLIMYGRIFPTRSVKLGGSALGVVVLMWWIVVCTVDVFQCRPIQKSWGLYTSEGTCIDKGAWFTGVAIPNIVTDAAILSLPIREVSRLHLSRARKLAIAGIFLLGGVVVIISCIRFRCMLDLRGMKDEHLLQQFACAWWWTDMELSIGCVSACLPTLRPLVGISFGWLSHQRNQSSGAGDFNAVATIGSAPLRRPAVTSGDREAPFQRLGDRGALASHLYSLPQHHSTEGMTPVSGQQALRIQNEVIAMNDITR